MSVAPETLVVVGAGLAGLRAAEGARAAGFTGRILLISDELHEPYDRPPLSKAVLLGQTDLHDIALSKAGARAAQAIELLAGRAVTAIDRAMRQVTLADGECLGYDKLVLATGSRVRILEALPPTTPQVFYLRTLDDALALRARLTDARSVVVVGAGVIGLEVSAGAKKLGCTVTVVEVGQRAMARTCCKMISDYFEARHRAEGVAFRFGLSVVRAEPCEDGAIMLVLSDGSVIDADLVVVGVGVEPNAELARASGLAVEGGGIVVDGQGHCSDPAIFAAGEVAMHFNALSGRYERQETWAHAAAHGDHVGRVLVSPGADYAEIASYWTDQFDINLQSIGAPTGEIDVLRGDIESGSFVVFHMIGGIVAGVSGVNAVRELRAAKKLIGQPVDATALADSAIGLKELIQS